MSQPETGKVIQLQDGLRSILAPNPGPMTYWGTNTFLLGEKDVAIIDPGPLEPEHSSAIIKAIGAGQISHILVTHAHLDHSPLAAILSHKTGAPVYAFGPPTAGRRPLLQQLAMQGLAGGGEGVDQKFLPSVRVGDGDYIEGSDWKIKVHHTPGHFAGHLAFQWNDVLLSGDHVMGWASSLVSPPDGDLRAFMDTSHRLKNLGLERFYPAHGAALENPAERLEWLIAHRKSREEAILNALSRTPANIKEITLRAYRDVDQHMLPIAERNVFAHLIDLVERKLAMPVPNLDLNAKYKSANS